MTSTQVAIPKIFVNPNKYPVVIPDGRSGATHEVPPGGKVIGEHFKTFIDVKKGIRPLLHATPSDFVGAYDPKGEGQKYLDSLKSRPGGKTAVPDTGPMCDGKTPGEWAYLLKSDRGKEHAMSMKVAGLKEIAKFLGIEDVDGLNTKPELFEAIIAKI